MGQSKSGRAIVAWDFVFVDCLRSRDVPFHRMFWQFFTVHGMLVKPATRAYSLHSLHNYVPHGKLLRANTQLFSPAN